MNGGAGPMQGETCPERGLQPFSATSQEDEGGL